MSKLIKTWDELFEMESDNYRIKPDEKWRCSGWIVPKVETEETKENYFDHHAYLSTHTFYGSQYEYSTELLQKFGFDVEIDNWDKTEEVSSEIS